MSGLILGVLLISNFGSYKVPVDLDAIVKIESAGKPKAFNRHSQARGLFQITPIVLQEWNNFHPEVTFKLEELFDPKINEEVARWYLGVRIPQMLRHYEKPVTIENIIICWNAGIKYVLLHDRIPTETSNYIMRYRKLTK